MAALSKGHTVSPFWRGWHRAWGSRIIIDMWLIANGIMIGILLERQNWVMLITLALITSLWLRLSHARERHFNRE